MDNVTLVPVFIAGVASFVSPCALPAILIMLTEGDRCPLMPNAGVRLNQ
jgi:cytochrome c biogenesis protein CcdA